MVSEQSSVHLFFQNLFQVWVFIAVHRLYLVAATSGRRAVGRAVPVVVAVHRLLIVVASPVVEHRL